MSKRMKVTLTRTFVMDDLWFDAQYYDQLVGEAGMTPEEALKVFLRLSWQEDPTGVMEEMLGHPALGNQANVFADSCTAELVEVD